ncbi:hypothetical protein BSKO_08413 [Bryopsis sp. KO-2023]|nr:hypothetical protein BSKO_08413 [Bryopsis sp. KO-2023]
MAEASEDSDFLQRSIGKLRGGVMQLSAFLPAFRPGAGSGDEQEGIELETFAHSFTSRKSGSPDPEGFPVRPAPLKAKPRTSEDEKFDASAVSSQVSNSSLPPRAPVTPERKPQIPAVNVAHEGLTVAPSEPSSESLTSCGADSGEVAEGVEITEEFDENDNIVPDATETGGKSIDSEFLEAIADLVHDDDRPAVDVCELERDFLARLINRRLGEDADLVGMLPVKVGSNDIFDACASGVLSCKLINSFVVEAVDERALNLPSDAAGLRMSDMRENHRLGLNSLRTLCRISDLDDAKLARGEADQILKLLWQIVRVGLLQDVDVRRTRELRILQNDDEDIFHMLQLTPETLLLRWINFCIEQSGLDGSIAPIQNFGEHLKDCKAYLAIQHRVSPEICDMDAFREPNVKKRVSMVMENCENMGLECMHTEGDILSGMESLGKVLMAQLFWHGHGLDFSDEEELETDPDNFEGEDEGSREERTSRMWMNSLGCDMHCMNLFSEDFRSGWMLLQVLDAIEPGCVDWKRAFKPPFKAVVRRIKSVENCNQVLAISRDVLNASLVGIGGDDIADGKRKPILALVWQLMRIHTMRVLRSGAGGAPTLSEADLLGWANQLLQLQGSRYSISSFKDPELGTGKPLLDLLKAIEPNAVNEKHIHPGVTPLQRELNAKYVISVARKLGAAIFVVWEDIAEVKPKILEVLLTSLMVLERQRRRLQRVGGGQSLASRHSISR